MKLTKEAQDGLVFIVVSLFIIVAVGAIAAYFAHGFGYAKQETQIIYCLSNWEREKTCDAGKFKLKRIDDGVLITFNHK
jgi:hypothetical protein